MIFITYLACMEAHKVCCKMFEKNLNNFLEIILFGVKKLYLYKKNLLIILKEKK